MIRDEIKEQQGKLKGKSLRKKIGYFFYYYKIHTLVSIVCIVALISMILSFIENSKEPSIYLAMVNSRLSSADESGLIDNYVKSRGLDTDAHPAKFDVSIRYSLDLIDEASVANTQKLMALFTAGDIDVMVAPREIILDYAELSAFANLKEVLPPELYAEVEGFLMYYEHETEGRIPIGIYISDNEKIMEGPSFTADQIPILSIVNTSERTEAGIDFLEFVLDE